MTTRLPDGTIRLSWDGREEAVVPGDLDGWAPVEEIAHPNLPEVSPEISPTLVLDIETTGLDPTQDRILAVGLALYRDGQEEVCEVLQGPDERDLLSRAFQRIRELAPEGGVLVGYNILGFDLPLLYLRAQELGIKCPFEPLRGPRGEAVTRRVAATAGIISRDPIEFMPFRNDLGLQVIDALHLAARYEFTTRSLGVHKDLKSVAAHFGIAEPARVVIPHERIARATPEELEEYVKADLKETFRVFERLVPPYLVISRLVGLPLEDVVTRSTAWVWEQILERHYGRTEEPDEKQDYPGGLVVSRPGLYYPCAKLDVASLYPTVMLAYRIHSRKDVEGYALSWLRALTEKRLELKERAKRGDAEAKVVQEGLKVLLNSLYGFYGTGGYGYNDMAAAQRITEMGRRTLTMMISAVEDTGGVVVEGDTDGLLVCAQDPERVLEAVQRALPEPFHVDIEWSDAIVFVSDRKNYIVLDKEGRVIAVKGAKWRGRDKEAIWTRFPCEFLRKLVFQGQDAAMEYAKEVEEEITSGRGWDWVKRTHRVSASDKYLLEAGFSEGEVATYAYKEKRKRVVSRSAEEGYDVGFYSTMLRRVVEELMEAIGHEGVTACNAT
jgi:DNA polymerase elongation subunit (family B)